MKSDRKKASNMSKDLTMKRSAEDKLKGKLKHNPDRLKEIAHELIKEGKLKKEIEACNTMSDELMKKEIIETRLRNIIFGTLLIFGGGSRPSTISRIKRKEFDEAEAILIDGEEIMKIHVWADKTSNTYGSATIAFMFPGLYTLTKKYLRVYKHSLKSN